MQLTGVRSISIKWVVLAAILSITTAFAGSIGWGILQSWSAYHAAQEQRQFDQGANRFIKGLYEVLLERLASNNALQAPEAASTSVMAAIDAHRKIVNENFDVGLASLEQWEFPDKASLLSTLKSSMQKADDYRRRSDEAIKLPRERRDSDLVKTFVPAMTEMVNVSLKLWFSALYNLAKDDPKLARLATIKEIGGIIDRISDTSTVIAAAVTQQGSATQEIARSVQRASAGTNQVATSISEVDRVASENGSAAANVLACARSLAQESSRLGSEMGKFLSMVRAA